MVGLFELVVPMYANKLRIENIYFMQSRKFMHISLHKFGPALTALLVDVLTEPNVRHLI